MQLINEHVILLARYILLHIPYFLRYSWSKIYAIEHNFSISEIIRASKLRGRAVRAKISTPRKLSVAKVYENSFDTLIARRTADRSRQVMQLGSYTPRACSK